MTFQSEYEAAKLMERYKQDVAVFKEPWKFWQVFVAGQWRTCTSVPFTNKNLKYRRNPSAPPVRPSARQKWMLDLVPTKQSKVNIYVERFKQGLRPDGSKGPLHRKHLEEFLTKGVPPDSRVFAVSINGVIAAMHLRFALQFIDSENEVMIRSFAIKDEAVSLHNILTKEWTF